MTRLSPSQFVVGALVAATLGCTSTGTTGPGGTNTVGPGGTTTANLTCLLPPAIGGTVLECSAKAQFLLLTDGNKQLGNPGTVPMAVGAVQTGKTADADIGLKNLQATITAAGLTIESVRLKGYEKGSADELDDTPALECWNKDATKRCADMDKAWRTVIPGGMALGANQTILETIKIRYTRLDAKDRSATLEITLGGIDPKNPADKVVKLNVKTVQGKPKLTLAPADGLQWPYVQPNKCEAKKYSILNSGDSLLVITQIKVNEIDPSFVVKLVDPADLDTAEHPGGKPWTLPKPLEIAVSGQAEFEVKFCPKDDKKKGGVIKFDTNDSNPPAMPVSANSAVPCIQLVPANKYQFGGVMPGSQPGEALVTIKNCGSVELAVTSIDFVAGETQSSEFTIDQSPLGPKMSAKPPVSEANPLKLPVAGQADFKVSYAPADITPEGTPPDIAVVQVKSNAFIEPKLTLEGVGVKETCPVAQVVITEGEQVVPQTTIHLIGAKSYAPGGGTIKKFKWTVKQPAGSNQSLVPNAALANPTFLANAAGEYQFCLEVWDGNDAKSCVPACKDVLVIPNNALHIELLWDTPSDPDQTDSGPAAGADLDMHFAHPLAATLDLDCDTAADPWFSNPWDTFWFNAAPEWGNAAFTKDNPTLDLDDTDGAGPENLNLVDPEGSVEEAVQYSVGVHYWNDHGYGTSYATVSIYIQGGLALQFTKVKMDPLDMWYVGKVNWPNTASGGGKKVFETCYQGGYSCPAKKNLMWQPKGDWCMTKCYVNKSFVGTVGGAATGKCTP